MKPDVLTYDLGFGVCAFSTERRGGYSEGTYASFNANAYCGDDERMVRLNRELLCRHFDLQTDRLIIPHQVHGVRVRRIDEAFFVQAEEVRQETLESVDAVMTNLSRVCVSVSTADCIPLLIYDEVHHAIAAVHAGWRGTVARIPEKTLEAMAGAYGTRPEDVRIAIGPGISMDAFEVGEEVYEAFSDAGFPMCDIARRYPSQGEPYGKWHIDLWSANRGMLERMGVATSRIYTSGICTYQNHRRFFSARRLGIHSGRILNGIFLIS